MACQRIRPVAVVLVSVLLLPHPGAAQKVAVPHVSTQPSIGGASRDGQGGSVRRQESRVAAVTGMILSAVIAVIIFKTESRRAPKGWGRLRLKVKPEHAQVFVDGYFVGLVDRFDGVFQRLHIEPGPHRIEFRADGYGYEPLTYDVLVQPDRTITYTGALKPAPWGSGLK